MNSRQTTRQLGANERFFARVSSRVLVAVQVLTFLPALGLLAVVSAVTDDVYEI